MKFLINVSQYDIETAERRNSHRCMVANAFLRSTDGAFLRGEVDVDGLPGLGWCIGITPVDGRLPRVLPLRKIEGGERLDHLITRWDYGEDVEPFSFWIDLPPEILQPFLPVEGLAHAL